jgi:hypothetical protein
MNPYALTSLFIVPSAFSTGLMTVAKLRAFAGAEWSPSTVAFARATLARQSAATSLAESFQGEVFDAGVCAAAGTAATKIAAGRSIDRRIMSEA